jgi:hypothetical protein
MMSSERKATSDLLPPSVAVSSGLPAPLTDGRPLDAGVRQSMEAGLHHDFGSVRIHTGAAASAAAAALSARAYTVGSDIVFGSGQYAPATAAGRQRLAHELAHVAQQRHGGAGRSAQAEPAARAAGQRVARGERVSPADVGGTAPGIYCDGDDEKKQAGDPAPGAVARPADAPLRLTLPSTYDPAAATAPALRPPFQLPPEPQIDWLKLRTSYAGRGVPMADADTQSILQTWDRNSRLLSTLGITDRFKFLFITKDWLLNKSIAKQVEDQQAREHPNVFDRADREWKAAHPGAIETPMIPLFDLDWVRKREKAK